MAPSSSSHPPFLRPPPLAHGQHVSPEDYQRLDFLGDALLDFIVLSHLYVRNPKWDPGRLTAEKAALVGNQFLAWVATDWLSVYKYMAYDDLDLLQSLEIYVRLADRDPNSAPKALPDVLEAMIAAVYLDSGGDISVVNAVFLPLLSTVPEAPPQQESLEFEMADYQDDTVVDAETVALLHSASPSLKVVLEAALAKPWESDKEESVALTGRRVEDEEQGAGVTTLSVWSGKAREESRALILRLEKEREEDDDDFENDEIVSLGIGEEEEEEEEEDEEGEVDELEL